MVDVAVREGSGTVGVALRQEGMFDWSETVLADSGLTNLQKSFRMSDHFPLWVEFEVP